MSEPSDVSGLLSVAQAIAILDATAVEPRILELDLAAARGLRLARDIVADRDYPPFDKSLMDGFAVRCDALASVPAMLRPVGEVAAGAVAQHTLIGNETIAIMTGAPLPPGADGIVPVEDIERVTNGIRVLRATTPGRYIARRGSDCRAGETILSRGTLLGAAQLGSAASVGAARVNVYDRPTASVLATGDELISIDQSPSGSQIRNSNSLMLLTLLDRFGCRMRDLGIVRDDPALIREAMLRGMESDLLFVSGGMSMGDYDWCPRILAELGVDLRITKLKIKPGKPFLFGVYERPSRSPTYVFGLPGNPVSGFVCTVRLASRLIARLSGGDAESAHRWLEGTLTDALGSNGSREFYQPVVYHAGTVKPLAWKGSADLYTLAAANALLVRAENEPAQPAGARVRVLEIPS